MGTKRRRVRRVRRTVPTKPKQKVVEQVAEPKVVQADGDRLFKVCMDWDLRIPDYVFDITQGELDKYKSKVTLMPYSHLLMRKLYDAGYGAWCIQMMIEYLGTKYGQRVKKVAEYCGGVGRSTIIIQNVLSPIGHTIIECDEVLCRHLAEAFPPVVVANGDYVVHGILKGMDLSMIDNNSFTVHKFLNPKFGQKEFIIKVLKNSKFTLITDTAKSRFHLNKERYANLFGNPIESEYDYIMEFSKLAHKLAGASVTAAASHPRASYILFEKGVAPADFQLVHPSEADKDYFQLADGERPITVREEHVKEPIVEVIEE